MYQGILHTHNFLRWLVLITLVVSVLLAITALLGKKPFSAVQEKFRKFTVIFTHVQLLIGLILYFTSPLIQQFLGDFKTFVKMGAYRYFGMDHSVAMLLSVVLITVGSIKAKKATTDHQKNKQIALWMGIALLIIFATIPWPFSNYPRPLFPGM